MIPYIISWILSEYYLLKFQHQCGVPIRGSLCWQTFVMLLKGFLPPSTCKQFDELG